jgi:hypothetical protein
VKGICETCDEEIICRNIKVEKQTKKWKNKEGFIR